MEKISVVIITKNEEKNIERCLKSLDNVANEIIVVDSFSTDNTEAICKKFNVNFVQRKFTDYADQKNYGNSLAKHSYILSLDADEALSDKLKESILKAIKQPMTDGYYFNRLTNYCGKWIHHCGWYPDKKLRLFNKSKSKWVKPIHEYLEINNGTINTLKGDLLHYSFENIESHLDKLNQFTTMAAKELFEKNKKVSVLKVLISPPIEFFKKYILKLGILDGYYGFVVCVMSAYYRFNKYSKLKLLWQKHKHNASI